MSKQQWNKTLDYYTKTHKKAPGEAKGLDWSEESQNRRFDILLEGIRERSAQDSVLDVGCGYGDLSRRINWTKGYQGIDLNPLMIEAAQKRYPDLEFRFVNLDDEDGTYDWIVSSGAFNVKIEDNEALLNNSIKHMWQLARKGVTFNVLVTGSDIINPEVHFYDATKVLKYCRSITPYVVCRLDYMPHDGTYYLYREVVKR